jgi:hypothetical protein
MSAVWYRDVFSWARMSRCRPLRLFGRQRRLQAAILFYEHAPDRARTGGGKCKRELNLRQSKTIEEITPKPPPTKAWVSVKVKLEDARKLVDVTKAEKATDANSPSPLVGVIGPQSLFSRLKDYFWRDVSRDPMSSGIERDPGKEYTILVMRRDASSINFCENFL